MGGSSGAFFLQTYTSEIVRVRQADCHRYWVLGAKITTTYLVTYLPT